jgi:bacillithiol system protein YtxJ
MKCTPLETADALQQITDADHYTVILKHNTTCPISKGVLTRLQADDANIPGIDAIHVLDLHAHRDISDDIASRFGVPHQSPQILLVKGGRCVYHEWGYDIDAEKVAEEVSDN